MKYPQLVSMPSAVSDWLEEQLEARGIDAVVYTRYVLSLLHRDTLDLVSSDQDIQLPKDVRQTGGRGRKRFRRSAEWWSHVRADVEQLRRSAAVECLMSASDQKCGIESLVDELCEKLKHFESSSTVTNEPCDDDDHTTGSKLDKGVISPNDLARRYYAAFPPLNNNNNTPTKSSDLITLIPQLYTTASNNQTNSGLINKRKHASRKNPPQTRATCRDTRQRKTDFDNMKSQSGGKQQRFSYFGCGKKDFGFARSMEKSEWDLYFMNGHNRADEGYSTSDTTGVDEAEECEIMDNSGGKTIIDDGHLAQLVAKFDRRIEALWKTDEEENYENEYHDLPVDLQELLSSPARIDAIEYSDKREKSKSFIQCGTNITSSIWSENITNSIWSECADEDKSLYDSISYCNLYNETLENFPDKILGDQFNSLTMNADKIDLGTEPEVENETNIFYENFSNEKNKLWKFNALKQDFTSLPWELTFPIGSFNNKKWSDAENYSYADSKFSPDTKSEVNRVVNDSLLTLNHNKEASCFKEVVPKQVLGLPSFTAPDLAVEDDPAAKEEEDLLTSTRTHFRPIKETTESTTSSGVARYADGTTFAIRSSLEHVNYKRSESGTLYLESGLDSPKKYMEYRVKDVPVSDTDSCYSIEREFVLKFCVKQNEKCCQTEVNEAAANTSHSPLEVPAKKRVLCDPEEFFFPGDEELLSDTVEATVACECKCPRTRAKLATNLEPLFAASSETCAVHGAGGARPDSTEITWNTSWKKCDKCNKNWSAVWGAKPETWKTGDALTDAQSWQHIWSSSEELCRSCLGMPAGTGVPTGRSMEYFKLREELSEDGEQLLSDLSCLQRVYMEQLPSTEVSCNLNEPTAVLAVIDSGNKERKRRHSSSQRPAEAVATAVARNSWTNASCLRSELLCHFTPPLLRPVTL